MDRRRYRMFVVCGALAGAVVLGVWGWRAWTERDLDRRVEVAVAALRDNPSDDVIQQTIERLRGRVDRIAEHQLLAGGLLLHRGDAAAALRVLLSAPAAGKFRRERDLMIGAAYFQVGRLAESEQAFRSILRENPDDADAHLWLAKVHQEAGAFSRAIAEGEEAIRLRPDHYEAYELVGAAYAGGLRQHADAAGYYRQALDRSPPESHRVEIRRELARCLLLTDEFAEILQRYGDAPENPLEETVVAEAHWRLGHIEEAQRRLQRLETTHPDLEGVLMVGAMMAIERGDAPAAVPRLKKLLEQQPADFVARHQLSLAYQMLGDTAASKAESERMLEYRKLHKRREELITQRSKNPGDPAVYEELADVCERLGDPTAAARWRSHAAQIRHP